MARMGKTPTTVGVTATMVLGGGAAAQAYSWGTLSVYDGGLAGQGRGSISQPSTSSARLHSYLGDMSVSHGRTYAEMSGWGGQTSFTKQSGRRADAHRLVVQMVDATFSAPGFSLNGSSVRVRVCQDISRMSDPCSGWSPVGGF